VGLIKYKCINVMGDVAAFSRRVGEAEAEGILLVFTLGLEITSRI
jgi:hypothetical protein